MSATCDIPGLTLAQATRIVREAMRDKSYQLTPIGAEVAAYLRVKRKSITAISYRGYESSLDKLARHFADLELQDFEPPVGTERLEEYLDHRWGDAAPGTYNVNLSITADFFKWAVIRGYLHGNPTTAIGRARKRQVHRTTFNADDRRRIIAGQESLRDRIALRLLLDYGLRKGALQRVQYKHFDHVRKRLTIFTKAQKIRDVPLPDPAFWHDLERHILDAEAQPDHFLMASFKVIPRVGVKVYPEKPMSDSAGMHRWWYGCLHRAGIVPEGTTKGERMHKARHTAGQRVLDATGDLKLVQKLLGHESIRTTGDIYVDYDIDQWAAMLADVLRQDDDESFRS
jgi:site-specific recombinase XerC